MTISCTEHARLLETIEEIYDAGFDRLRWPEALQAIGALVDASVVLLREPCTTNSGSCRIACAAGLTGAQVDRYDRFQIFNPFAITPPFDRADPIVRVVRRSDHADSPFFTHFADELGLDSGLAIGSCDRDGLSLVVWRTTGTIATVATSGTSGTASTAGTPISDEDARRMRRVWPHIVRARALLTRTCEPPARSPSTWAESLIERWPIAIVSLGADGAIRHANQLARDFAGSRDGFGLAFDGPVASTAGETRMLRQAIRAMRERAAAHDEYLRLTRPSGCRPYEVVLRRTPSFEAAQAGVVMLIADPEARPDLCTRALRTLYKLTPAEARIARRLVHGAGAEEIAADLRLSPKTTRWYVGQLREKLGACSQTEIVRLILSGPLAAGSPTAGSPGAEPRSARPPSAA